MHKDRVYHTYASYMAQPHNSWTTRHWIYLSFLMVFLNFGNTGSQNRLSQWSFFCTCALTED